MLAAAPPSQPFCPDGSPGAWRCGGGNATNASATFDAATYAALLRDFPSRCTRLSADALLCGATILSPEAEVKIASNPMQCMHSNSANPQDSLSALGLLPIRLENVWPMFKQGALASKDCLRFCERPQPCPVPVPAPTLAPSQQLRGVNYVTFVEHVAPVPAPPLAATNTFSCPHGSSFKV